MYNILTKTSLFISLFLCLLSSDLLANKIKIGSLQYGSVNWELKLIQDLEIDKKKWV